MDKETLSNYGWIVVLVLILAVMLALATPFGTFIAGAIKSTTAGLFNVNQAALGSAGIDVNDMVFENCDHLETEIRNATDTYTGDTCCKACGAVLQAGQTVRAKVPEGGKYTAADGTVYNPGDEMPEVVTTGDIYRYGDYEYRYNQHFDWAARWITDEGLNGWGVDAIEHRKTSYGPILESINSTPVVSLSYTFYDCQYFTDVSRLAIPESVVNMERTFMGCPFEDASTIVIPSNVTTMQYTFCSCVNLKKMPDMSKAISVTNLSSTFASCRSLTNLSDVILPPNTVNMERTFEHSYSITYAPAIPNSVTTLYRTFFECKALIAAPSIIPSNVTSLSNTFSYCEALVSLPDITQANKLTSLDSSFSYCKALVNLSEFIIPSNITSLSNTFAGCTSLEKLPQIPNNVTNMAATFYGCTSLTDENMPIMPSGVKIIDSAFAGCTSLVNLENYIIPSNVSSMSNLFSGCTSLVTAPIISTRTAVPQGLFKNCTSLTGVITVNNTSANSSNMFSGVDFEAQQITLTGNTEYHLDTMGATGINYCAECNGCCKGGH